MPQSVAEWWRHAVVYQVYVRSFADGNGDGVGDLAGVRSRLGYLHALGVDAMWFNPWYASPLADGGYDVADYRAIEPSFGTLAEAETLIAEALEMGIRTIIDIVPNHVSDQHPWFVEALEGGPASPMRDRFWFRPGRGANGELPPNEWQSHFGESAWTRTKQPDGTPGDWYLHLFAPAQPDLNWNHPAVRREHEDVLRFWFDRGAAGFRIDSAVLAIKHPDLPDVEAVGDGPHPYVDRDEIHDLYRSWRAIADGYEPPRVLVGEVWLEDTERFGRYLRDDELHGAFNFDFLAAPWTATALRTSIRSTLEHHSALGETSPGAPASWVLANHDVTRVVTRYGRDDSSFSFAAKRHGTPTDLELGTRRARAAILLAAALPGTLYVYQGDELGLPEVEGLAPEHVQDPMFFQSGGVDPGRDGCRIPLPWTGSAPPYGFGADESTPWLPQPPDWAPRTAAAQADDPASMLALYRNVIARRRSLGDAELVWLDSDDDVIAFRRGDVACVVNLGASAAPLPAGTVLITSSALDDGALPTDAAAWIALTDAPPAPNDPTDTRSNP